MKKERIKTIVDWSILGVGVALAVLLAILAPLDMAVSIYIGLAFALVGAIVERFVFSWKKYDLYFWFNQGVLTATLGFFTLGTFTSSLTFTCIALAGLFTCVILFLCVWKNGERAPEERKVQRTWKSLSRKIARLGAEEARSILEESLRYQLVDDQLNGSLQLDKPIFSEGNRAVSYTECESATGKAIIGAYLDRIVDNKPVDKDVEVQ